MCVQIVGYLYSVLPFDNDMIKEIRCIVMVLQVGNHQSVILPHQLPEHYYLNDLKLLGWLHTQPNELTQLPPNDVLMYSRVVVIINHGMVKKLLSSLVVLHPVDVN